MIATLPYPPSPTALPGLNAAELRRTFLIDNMFSPGAVTMCLTHADRAVVGAAVPLSCGIELGCPPELASALFTERREIGILNLGGVGTVQAGGREHELGRLDALYVGRGPSAVRFRTADPAEPALFYFVSYPASSSHLCKVVRRDEARCIEAGEPSTANVRTIRQYIRPDNVETSQLTLGLTSLSEGSVWNTMPAHTHVRRTEIYLYFGLQPGAFVLHCLGEPHETRHIVVRDREAVVSPEWSIHTGAGTSSYSFVWAMGGENREFGDMQHVAMDTLR